MIDVIIEILGQDENFLNRYIENLDFEEENIGGDIYIKFMKLGFSLRYSDKIVDSIIFYAKNKEGYAAYNGTLPFNLRFSMNREGVRSLLGDPSFIREAKMVPVLGALPPLDRYDVDGKSYAISYDDRSNSITKINIFVN
ncbi:hypothetical protein [Asaia astilbis]|uniref:hypothetical protein n=1 Tax=Asaia astilbis TaxID=610244 RepID=UPI00046F9AB2|nr:hypothetical protein [Asaia astilbis]